MADYDVGDLARLTATFTDENGDPIDPATVTLTAEKPDDTSVEYVYGTDLEVALVQTGVYRATFEVDQEGVWFYRWSSTGTGKAAEEGQIEVRPSPVVGTTGLAKMLPDVDRVGMWLRARTVDNNSRELGTFTANTRPTAAQVWMTINDAADDVVGAIGTDLAEQHRRAARSIIALGASLGVELTYFPEQVQNNRSAYEHYVDLYEKRLTRLIEAVAEAGAGGGGGSVATAGFLPTGVFPSPESTRMPGAENPV